MLEAATTSHQVHLQVTQANAARYYNASLLLSAPLVAMAANSPFLFGHSLWEETRIPVFEQAVSGCEVKQQPAGHCGRVTFGAGYVQESLLECFVKNFEDYPVLLPESFDHALEQMKHVRFHNGTIWRWNRPLLGVNGNGEAHLRIEQRVLPAGPSFVDMTANMAVYMGLAHYYANQKHAPELRLPFAEARNNFYQSARYGLANDIFWLDGKTVTIQTLWLEQLLPQTKQGLIDLGLDHDEISYYVDQVVRPRIEGRQTGAQWQRDFVKKIWEGLCRLDQGLL